MKILVSESQYRRIFLNEDINPVPTVADTLKRWPTDNPFYPYHNDPEIKDLPFINSKKLKEKEKNENFILKYPKIVVTNYDYKNPKSSTLIIMVYNDSKKRYELDKTLFGELTISTLDTSPLCQKNKKMDDMINACVDWKKKLVKVGTYQNTSGGKRKDGCKGVKNYTPDWLHGCGDHPYGSDAYLHPEAAKAFNKMNSDYKNIFRKKGIGINSAYRDVFHQGGVNSDGKPKAGSGKSNHGFGLALDIGKGHNWVKKNGGYYGWCWFGPDDDPHFNYFPLLDEKGLRYTCVSKNKKRQQYEEGHKKK